MSFSTMMVATPAKSKAQLAKEAYEEQQRIARELVNGLYASVCEASVVKALEAGTTIAIGALKNLWCEVYHTQRRGESAEEARERSIGEMLTDTGITREQFDEWKVSKPDSKGAADGDGK